MVLGLKSPNRIGIASPLIPSINSHRVTPLPCAIFARSTIENQWLQLGHCATWELGMTSLDRLEGTGILKLSGEPDLEVGYLIQIYRRSHPDAPGHHMIPDVSGRLTTPIEPTAFLPYANKEAALELEDGQEAEILFHGAIGHFVVNKMPGL